MNGRATPALIFAALVLALAAGCAHTPGHVPVQYVHFFVAPKALPDGSDATPKLEALKAWLCEKAGGYTEIPDAPGGWINHQNKLESAEQAGFIVSAGTNLKAEIAARIEKEFAEKEAYVLVWKAER